MLDAEPYSEQGELRLRARDAVLEGLSESGFARSRDQKFATVAGDEPFSRGEARDVR